MRIVALALFLLLFLAGCSQQAARAVMPDGTVVELEVVDTALERARGLSNRESLCADCGMLFVFEQSSSLGFWMPRMNFPLDIIFLDENYVVVDVARDMQPCREECIVYRSRADARYVLEVNAGFADEHGVVKGVGIEVSR